LSELVESVKDSYCGKQDTVAKERHAVHERGEERLVISTVALVVIGQIVVPDERWANIRVEEVVIHVRATIPDCSEDRLASGRASDENPEAGVVAVLVPAGSQLGRKRLREVLDTQVCRCITETL
jgi:hypothetical protein